jgi:putative metallohydrolase (TIGR04338 family)
VGPDQRDSQRSRVYAAETQVARIIDARVVPDDRKFGDLESVQRYVDAVLALNWVRARWPDAAERAVSVRARAGAGKAHYEHATATIALPPFQAGGGWALRELVVLHELAHHVTDESQPVHGQGFVANLLVLVSELLGPEAEFLLRTTFAENGVA